MKKTLFAIVSLAVLAMGCVKEQQPSETPADSKGVSTIRISMAPTKVSVDETTGACAWQDGDQIAVWFANADATAGQRVVYTFKTVLSDGSAEFETSETITEGYAPAKVTYPAECLNGEGGWGLIRNWEYKEGFIPMYARTEEITVNDDGSLSAQLYHNASVFKFTLHDIPAYAAGFVLEAVKYNKNEAGEFVDADGKVIDKENATPSQIIAIKTSFPYKTGYTADPADNSNDITLYSVAAHGSYLTRVYLVDGDGDEIEGSEKRIKQSWNDVSTDDFIEFPRIDFKKADLRKDFVKVCGIKWAKGNLQCYQNNGDAGFQNGWRIAPAQWHNLHYKEASTASDGKATAYGYSNDSNKFEHFNYGGIARQARFVSAGNYIVEPASGLDISGKVYSDVNATAEVTGNAAFKEIDTFADANHDELWGDIAYWASKGKYRLPKNTEMVKLHNVSDKLAGYYKTSDGSVVYGFLYRTPNPSRVGNNTNQEFTDADLESGLFLPKAGRRGATSAASGTIINVMTQGMYRTSTYVKSVTNSDVLYYCSAYYSLGDGGKLADDNLKVKISSILNVGYANAHQAGHLIRPVLAE